MRLRADIEADGKRADLLALEVLLDVRELLLKEQVKHRASDIRVLPVKKKPGRPKGIKVKVKK